MIFYLLSHWQSYLYTNFAVANFLFGSAELSTNADSYSGYSIGFDSLSKFSFTDGSIGKNVIIFGVDMSSYVHTDNTNKDILILTEGQTKRLDDNTLTA